MERRSISFGDPASSSSPPEGKRVVCTCTYKFLKRVAWEFSLQPSLECLPTQVVHRICSQLQAWVLSPLRLARPGKILCCSPWKLGATAPARASRVGCAGSARLVFPHVLYDWGLARVGLNYRNNDQGVVVGLSSRTEAIFITTGRLPGANSLIPPNDFQPRWQPANMAR
jgi:hypothetical protein